MSGLPNNWTTTTLDDLAEDISYGYTASSTKESVGPHLLRITDIQENNVSWSSVPYCEIDSKQAQKYLLKENDLLFARTGATVGKSFLIKGGIPDSVFASYLIRVRCFRPEAASYLAYYFRSQDYWRQITEFSAGIGQPNVNGSKLKGLNIPLPPLAEQTRIAAKLDELLAQVDTLKARIDGIPALLKRFRQSVLAAAVSGRLTEEWRAVNQSVHDAAEADLGRFSVVEHDEKYDAPPGWSWRRVGQVSRLINGDRGKNYPSKSELVESGIPFINAGHIDEGCRLSASKMNYISRAKFESLANGKINSGDVLFCLRGTVGKVALVEPYVEGAIASSLVIVRALSDLEGRFAFIYLRSSQCLEKIRLYDNGTAQPNLSAASLAAFPIAVPSKAEQKEIVRRVEQLFAFADQLEAKVNTAKTRIDRLTQSILAKAFRGELVPQDPNDEPASELLARIQALRASAPKARRGRKQAENT